MALTGSLQIWIVLFCWVYKKVGESKPWPRRKVSGIWIGRLLDRLRSEINFKLDRSEGIGEEVFSGGVMHLSRLDLRCWEIFTGFFILDSQIFCDFWLWSEELSGFRIKFIRLLDRSCLYLRKLSPCIWITFFMRIDCRSVESFSMTRLDRLELFLLLPGKGIFLTVFKVISISELVRWFDEDSAIRL